MEKSLGLYFHLRKGHCISDEEATIYLRITINGTRTELSTKRNWELAKWNIIAGRAEGKTELSKSLNSYPDVLQQKVYEIRKNLVENDKPVTAENIKVILQGGQLQEHKFMLMEIFQSHNNQMAELVGKEYSPGTLERYQTSFRHTQSFLQWKYKVNDIDVTKLDFEFISEYEFWLKSTRKCGHNSTIKYLSNFRKIHKQVFTEWLVTKRSVYWF